mmetsp:Transcript_16213/g.35042  ORF Transcript_16213/g.35042 Transcript_16213/m.35042 type:complete len:247 (-) Transcript_16213:113-853(-)|eukprot:CAMPEP_0172297832 /NCGR_PEP_ID=MMETSP1058-20130122/715_1 /TAXON_ID=83371 /ORGANISM="Detonula confervacea, Strain CCMP 353" /LENGTH=246 /DNA_ID=CAMNT_0013007033 /DNA_START=92 /DNA_END=832 /DNA_ORIENTATION=+
MTMTTMKTLASILLLASTTEAFTPPTTTTTITSPSTSTSLNHINTRHRIEDQELGIWPQSCQDETGTYVPCDAISGHERRAMWESYAPTHGSPTSYGAVGCPGGGDWCYASSYGAAAAISGGADFKKRAANVAAALAGLGSGVGGARVDGLAASIDKGGVGSSGAVAASGSSGSDGSIMGEDVREARTSYAPYGVHDGSVGNLGEIGAVGGSSGGGVSHAAAPSAVPSRRQVGPPKSYGLGSWKKN